MSGKSGMRNSGGGIGARGGAAARSAAGAMRRVRLGDVAEEVRENWSGPTADVPVVGLEHIEPDEMWLRKWEVNPDENTFSKAFRKGQLLFGRRRAYQKKLSLAPSDGICSGDITVIAAKSDKVVPSLLPFLLRTDKFFDYAIQRSAGSLSPRVKWAHLAKYEFDLPPMDEQKKLAELLWAANDLKESYKKAITATDEMLKAKFREMFGDAGDGENFNAETQRRREIDGGSVSHGDVETRRDDELREIRYLSIGEIGKVYTGSTPSMKVAEYYENKNVPFYKPSDFKCGLTILSTPEFYVDNRAESKCRMFNAGAVLVTCIATVGKVGLATCRGTCNQQINFIDPNENVDSRYLAFSMTFVGDKMAESAKASVVPIVNKSEFCGYKVPVPPLALQREFVAIADKAESSKANLKKSIAAIDQVMKGLINQ